MLPPQASGLSSLTAHSDSPTMRHLPRYQFRPRPRPRLRTGARGVVSLAGLQRAEQRGLQESGHGAAGGAGPDAALAGRQGEADHPVGAPRAERPSLPCTLRSPNTTPSDAPYPPPASWRHTADAHQWVLCGRQQLNLRSVRRPVVAPEQPNPRGWGGGIERTEAKQGVEPGDRDDPITYQVLTKYDNYLLPSCDLALPRRRRTNIERRLHSNSTSARTAQTY
jgi:hypothetical protein